MQRGGRLEAAAEGMKQTMPLALHPDVSKLGQGAASCHSIFPQILQYLTSKPSQENGVHATCLSGMDDIDHNIKCSLSTGTGTPLAEASSSPNSNFIHTIVANSLESTNKDVLLVHKEPIINCEPPFDEICVNFNHGCCKYEENCKRLHVLVDSKKVQETQAKTICKAFLSGFCRRGDRCPWLHPMPLRGSINMELTPKAICSQKDHIASDLQVKVVIVKIPRVDTQKQKCALVRHQRIKQSKRGSSSPKKVSNTGSVSEDPQTSLSLAFDDPPLTPIVKLPKYPLKYVSGFAENKLFYRRPTSASGVSFTLPSNYCRDWQKGQCSRPACKFLHVACSPQSKHATTVASDGVIVPGLANNVLKRDLIELPPGHCMNWPYKHSERPLKDAVGPSQKTDCMFCILGVCTIRHYTASSLMVPNFPSNVAMSPSDSTQTARVSNSIGPLQHVKRVQNARTAPSEPKPDGFTKKLTDPEEITVTLLKSTRVTLGPGFQILDIVTAFESNYVLLGNLPPATTEADIRSIAVPFGEILKVECWKPQSSGKDSTAKIQFASSTQAALAVAELNGSTHFSAKITAKPDYYKGSREVGRLSACVVRIDIPAPGITAYAGYETLKQAEKVIAAMHGATVKGHVVAAHLHNGLPKAGPFTVKFEGLPRQTTEKKVRTLGGGRPDAEGVLLGHVCYQSLTDVTRVLQNILEEHGNVISLDFPASPPVNGRIRGKVHFASAAGAAAACSALNGRRFAFLGSERIYLDHLHKLIYKASPEIYAALEIDLKKLQSFARGQPGVQMTITHITSGETEIELSGSHLDSLKKVKTPLEFMIAGETLLEQSSPAWDNFLSTAPGNSFIDNVSRSTRAHICVHHLGCFVKLWGTPAAKKQACRLILDKIRHLRARICFALPLSGKLLFQVLFNSLDAIHEELGKDNVFVDFRTRKLVIRGTEEQFNWAITSLCKGSTLSLDHRQYSATRDDEHSCPVCLDVVLDSIALSCGHKACKQCVVRYLVSASDHGAFPLKCLGNDSQCPELLPLPLCKKLLQTEQFSRLVVASFFSYIQMRPQEFHYCPTPDCPQIYRDTPGVVLQCPSCLVCICPSCHAVQHDGEECFVTNEASERLFREWKDAHNVKTCPRCSASIEKVAGCNHITCMRCSTHICWACMETFQTSTDVYEHMVNTHGGIGL